MLIPSLPQVVASLPLPSPAQPPLDTPLLRACLTYLRASAAPAANNDDGAVYAARALVAVVTALPELRPQREPTPEAPAWQVELWQISALLARLDDHTVQDTLFKARAEEVVARARCLQEAFPDARDDCSRIIRAVIRHTRERFVFVFGLRLSHETDWKVQAHRAKTLRVRLERRTQMSESCERSRDRVLVPAPKALVDSPRASIDLPLLREASARRSIVVVGGAAKSLVSSQVAEATGLTFEWIETRRDSGGARLVQAIAERIRRGGVAAVVIVEGEIRHCQFLLVVQAVRASNTSVAYAKRGGVLSVVQALRSIEERLARAESSNSAPCTAQ